MSDFIFSLSLLVICISAFVLTKVVKEIISLGFATYAFIKQSIEPTSLPKKSIPINKPVVKS